MQSNTKPLPEIAQNHYELCTVEEFLGKAPLAHRLRYSRDCVGPESLIIWDPEDDAEGFMITAHTVEELNREFRQHFAEWIDFKEN